MIRKWVKKLIWEVGNEREPMPTQTTPFYLDSMPRLTVYAIQNGYVVQFAPTLGHQPDLRYCADIKDLTDYLISEQTKGRLGLSTAKYNAQVNTTFATMRNY